MPKTRKKSMKKNNEKSKNGDQEKRIRMISKIKKYETINIIKRIGNSY